MFVKVARDRCEGGDGNDSIQCEVDGGGARAASIVLLLRWPARWPVSASREVFWRP